MLCFTYTCKYKNSHSFSLVLSAAREELPEDGAPEKHPRCRQILQAEVGRRATASAAEASRVAEEAPPGGGGESEAAAASRGKHHETNDGSLEEDQPARQIGIGTANILPSSLFSYLPSNHLFKFQPPFHQSNLPSTQSTCLPTNLPSGPIILNCSPI